MLKKLLPTKPFIIYFYLKEKRAHHRGYKSDSYWLGGWRVTDPPLPLKSESPEALNCNRILEHYCELEKGNSNLNKQNKCVITNSFSHGINFLCLFDHFSWKINPLSPFFNPNFLFLLYAGC